MRHNALQVLRHDHRELQRMFHQFERADGAGQDALCRRIVDELETHTRIEEEVLYPYLRAATGDDVLFEEATVEHGAADQLVHELERGSGGVHRQAVMKVLGEYVGMHIREEEYRIFPLVEKIGVDLNALGEALTEHKDGEKGNVMGAAGESPMTAGAHANFFLLDSLGRKEG